MNSFPLVWHLWLRTGSFLQMLKRIKAAVFVFHILLCPSFTVNQQAGSVDNAPGGGFFWLCLTSCLVTPQLEGWYRLLVCFLHLLMRDEVCVCWAMVSPSWYLMRNYCYLKVKQVRKSSASQFLLMLYGCFPHLQASIGFHAGPNSTQKSVLVQILNNKVI